MHSVMCQAVYAPGMDSDGKPVFDGQDAAETVLEQFSAHMSDLVKQSLAASFAPSLDDDGDSFLDPDGPNADDDDDSYGMMSANAQRSQKAGRTLSADNHALMTKALGMIGEGHKALSEFAKSNAPTSDAASAHADAGNPNPKNQGDEPPSASDNVYDPGFGKSAASMTAPYAHRAGALAAWRPALTAATTPTQGAGSASGADAGKSAATTHPAQQSADDDELAQMRALLAQMRATTTATPQPVAAQ
jgi:hypothetical protein